jgi:predicted metallopeptidase
MLPEAKLLSGFNFTLHMRHLCEDMILRLPELAHIDLARVAICYCQARKAVRHGLQATLTPLRFEGGALTTKRRRRLYTVQRLYDHADREMLYILSFYLPRFLDCPLEEKLITVLHELWHISPSFNGDLRRHPGRCYAHSESQKKYDAAMAQLARRWLSLSPPEELYDFLRLSCLQLARRHGGLYGLKVPAPKLLPLGDDSLASAS